MGETPLFIIHAKYITSHPAAAQLQARGVNHIAMLNASVSDVHESTQRRGPSLRLMQFTTASFRFRAIRRGDKLVCRAGCKAKLPLQIALSLSHARRISDESPESLGDRKLWSHNVAVHHSDLTPPSLEFGPNQLIHTTHVTVTAPDTGPTSVTLHHQRL